MFKETSLITVMGLCLKELRMKKDVTQSEIAEHIGMTNAGWGRLENGKASLSVENMVLACHFLDTTPEDLFKEINGVTKSLQSQGWNVHTKRIENDGLIAGRELESSYEKIKNRAVPLWAGVGAVVGVGVGAVVGRTVGTVAAVGSELLSKPKSKEDKKQKSNKLIKGDLVNKAASAYEWGWRESLKSNLDKDSK